VPSGDSKALGTRPIDGSFQLDAFQSGNAELDAWLKRRALMNEAGGASRTFVVAKNKRVVGYYALTVGSVTHRIAPGRIRRNMPDPVPIAILARLAVDQQWQGRKLGRDLLQDAVLRIISAAENLGIRAVLVHAISEDARRFYEHHGFTISPVEPLTLMATLNSLQHAASRAGLSPSYGMGL